MSQKAKKSCIGMSPRCYDSVWSDSVKHPLKKPGSFPWYRQNFEALIVFSTQKLP